MNKSIKGAALAVLAAGLLMPMAMASGGNDDATIARNLDIFNSVYKELNSYYVDTIDAERSIKIAIDAMLDDIDPYTEYFPPKKQDDLRVISTGEYGGIGSYIIERKDSNVYISEPYENSPAAKAGIKPGDRIVAIDGDSVQGWGSEKVSARLKGQANTKLELTIARPYAGPDSIKHFTLTRENIKVNPVPYYGVTRRNIGYIAITTFNENTTQSVKDALLELKKDPNVEYIVLDLRGNGGGLLESAVQVVGLFVPKGTQVLQTRGRLKNNEKTYKTTEDPIDLNIPLAVLIDGGSASASEITAGALQDLDRAIVIGSRSFGKGLVQSTRPLPFDGVLKVTIAKYYIPSGRLIQEIDYSKRNADGSYRRTTPADSLGHEFRTAHGRIVRDGGGITPDIKVTYPDVNRLVYNIVRDNWAFDFATLYASKHPTIAQPQDFVVDDSLYSEFKRFIDPKRFNYDKVCEQGLAELRKTAEREGYMNDSTRLEFDRMEKLLKHNLSHDLDVNRKLISQYLASEILKRYYYQLGPAIYATKDDECLDRAEIAFVTNYDKLLNLKPAGKQAKQGKASGKAKKK